MPQPPAQPHTWAVVHQEEEPTIDQDGQPTSLHHVRFKTNTGHESTVTIPDEQFNARNVAKAVAAKAAEIVKVHALNSTNAPAETEQ